jgi:hypothetical protein
MRRSADLRLIVLAAALALALVLGAVAVVSSGSGDDEQEAASPAAGPAAVTDPDDLQGQLLVSRQLAGLRQERTILGDPDAPVTVTELGDPQCAGCAVFAQSTLDQVLLPAVRDGEVKLDFRHWTIVAPDSARAARGALAASVQGRHWSFLQLYYRNQPADGAAVEQPFLEAVAAVALPCVAAAPPPAGVPDLDAWRASLGDPRWAQHLQESATLAQEEDFEGVPSFLVEGPGNSERFERPPTDAELGEALEAARPQSDG